MSQTKGSVSPLSLWYNPARFLQGLIQEGSGGLGAQVIAGLFGLVQSYGLYRAAPEPNSAILVAGPILGMLMLYLVSWLMRNFGRWFGAQAEIPHLRLAFGWGALPWLLAFGMLAWLSDRAVNPEDLAGLYPYFFAIFVYGYVILLLCLRSALGISLLKTFLCLIVTVLVSFFPLTLVAQLLLGPPPVQ